jgi:hypothetical protein
MNAGVPPGLELGWVAPVGAADGASEDVLGSAGAAALDWTFRAFAGAFVPEVGVAWLLMG